MELSGQRASAYLFEKRKEEARCKQHGVRGMQEGKTSFCHSNNWIDLCVTISGSGTVGGLVC